MLTSIGYGLGIPNEGGLCADPKDAVRRARDGSGQSTLLLQCGKTQIESIVQDVPQPLVPTVELPFLWRGSAGVFLIGS